MEQALIQTETLLEVSSNCSQSKREWDRNRSFVRIRFRRPTSAQLSKAVKADEISVVEPTQPLRLAQQSKDNWEARTFVPASIDKTIWMWLDIPSNILNGTISKKNGQNKGNKPDGPKSVILDEEGR